MIEQIIELTNTLSRTKEAFVPLQDNKVTLYFCGITPYAYSHIGHGRVYVTGDILVRLFLFFGYQVHYIRNITDIDDKILDQIEDDHSNITEKIKQLTAPYIADFHAQFEKLNCIAPTSEPYVTKSIKDIIEIIDLLIQQRHAYQIDDDIYFDIATLPSYGLLSGRTAESLVAGARVEVNPKKRNPGDFVLWKGNNSELYWESPWGYGRPGWHIECSAMISKYAKTIDIHGGGSDLIFPHHENECAQSEGAFGKPLARYWMHVEFLNINKEKMSKSLGNTILLKDLLAKYSPMAFRLYLLQHTYTTPLNFSEQDLDATAKAYQRLLQILGPAFLLSTEELQTALKQDSCPAFLHEALNDLCQDLNTARAIARFFEHLDEIKQSVELRQLSKTFFKHLLGITFDEKLKHEKNSKKITPEVAALLAQRDAARMAKNWKLADELRDQILQKGYTVHDKK